MPSYFTHFPPLGTKGVYMVGLVLHLKETEQTAVYVRRTRDVNVSCGTCGLQTPVSRTEAKVLTTAAYASRPLSNYVYYYIDRINAGDEIEVQVFDNRSDAFQCVVYTATMDGFKIKVTDCILGGTNLGPIYFNKITVIDSSDEEAKATILPEESAILWPPPKSEIQAKKSWWQMLLTE